MAKTLATNLFPLGGLDALSFRYRLHRIVGLERAPESFFINRRQLESLGWRLQCPVSVVERDGVPYLLLPDGVPPPESVDLTRTVVRFETASALDINFEKPSPELRETMTGILRFHVHGAIGRRKRFWRTASGQAFLYREPQTVRKGICHYTGFRVRAAYDEAHGFSLCVDPSSVFVHERSLATDIGRDAFARWQGRHAIYHYGDDWFSIRLDALAQENADEYLISDPAPARNLLEFIIDEIKKPIPPEVREVPADASVALYRNPRGGQRAAPTPLCYPVATNDESARAGLHRASILPPQERLYAARNFARRELATIRVGSATLSTATNGAAHRCTVFQVPDLQFGHDHVLSVRGSHGATSVTLEELGRERVAALHDPSIGLYDSEPLDEHRLLLPKSVWEGPGKRFVDDLKRSVEAYLHGAPFHLRVSTYSDTKPLNLARQGAAVAEALEADCGGSPYVLVMLHRVGSDDDQLAAYVAKRAAALDIRTSVIHSDMVQGAYSSRLDCAGERRYERDPRNRGRLTGYLRNVALNKVILSNDRVPFALATPLHADVVVGLDVKANTAALVAIDKTGSRLVDHYDTSRQKEQLREDQAALLIERAVQKLGLDPASVRNVVLHRDGQLFPSERRGAARALARLAQTGVVSSDACLTALEVLKTSMLPLRVFDATRGSDRERIENPQIGATVLMSSDDAYVCTTGRAFRHPGTTRPLRVRRVMGSMPLLDCAEDVFSLSSLAWSQPGDCSRLPITLRLLDRLLVTVADAYDDGLRFETELHQGELG